MKKILPFLFFWLALMGTTKVAEAQRGPCSGYTLSAKTECLTIGGYIGNNNTTKGCPKYIWDMGGTGTVYGMQVSYKFPKPGKYRVCVKVIDTCNKCDTVICETYTVDTCHTQTNPCQLQPDFKWKADCKKVWFSGYVNVSGATYSWSFGDGTGSTAKDPVKTYLKEGVYKVCLQVTYKDSRTGTLCKETVCKEVKISCGKPCDDLRGDFDFKVYPGGYVKFSGKSHGGFLYKWSYGDGNHGTGEHTKHQYKKPGVYQVCLTIYDRTKRCEIKICKKVVIESPCHLKGSFTFKVDGNTVKFYGYSFTGAYYSWDFGDGTSGYGKDPKHTYLKPGTYKVCLTIWTQNKRCKITLCGTVVIKSQDPVCAWRKNSRDSLGYFFYQTKCLEGVFEAPILPCVKYGWSINGTTHYGRFIRYSFPKEGTYQICLKMLDTCGKCDTLICKTIKVEDCNKTCSINAGMIVEQSTTCQKILVGAKFYDGIGAPCRKVYWSWGDGTYSTGMQADHKYAKGGEYEVCLKVWDSCGGCDTVICKKVWVKSCDPPCNVYASFGIDSVSKDGIVYFRNKTQGGYKYKWDFGDSSYSNDKTPKHQYKASGYYKVCLTAWDSLGKCSSTYCYTVTVQIRRWNGTAEVASTEKAPEVKVYPNPAVDQVYVEMGSGSNVVTVMNLQGKIVYTTNTTESRLIINSTGWSEGIYLIKVLGSGNEKTFKVVISK